MQLESKQEPSRGGTPRSRWGERRATLSVVAKNNIDPSLLHRCKLHNNLEMDISRGAIGLAFRRLMKTGAAES